MKTISYDLNCPSYARGFQSTVVVLVYVASLVVLLKKYWKGHIAAPSWIRFASQVVLNAGRKLSSVIGSEGSNNCDFSCTYILFVILEIRRATLELIT